MRPTGNWAPEAYASDCVRFAPRKVDGRWVVYRQVKREGEWFTQLHTAIAARDAEHALALATTYAYTERKDAYDGHD